jgi:hypothetical protein
LSKSKTVGAGLFDIDVWPKDQTIESIDRYIQNTIFPDTHLYHDALIARALELEEIKWGTDKPNSRQLGGRKVHHLDQWESKEADLLNERARELFRRTANREDAEIQLSWANIYRTWDFLIPHSHRESVASIVYFLEMGDPDPDDPLSGQLAFADPRIGRCCKEEEGYVTTLLYMDPVPGNMIIWPAPYVHYVTPYAGKQPRITLAWNIGRLPGDEGGDKARSNVPPTPTSRA